MVWAGAVAAAWSAARGWLTPAVLFVAVNVVIATIAIASRLVTGDGDQAAAGERRGRLLRAPSLAADRLRSSFSFSRLGLGGDPYAQPLLVSHDDAGAPEPEPALQPPAAEAPAQAERGREEEEEAGRIERSRSEAAAEATAAASTRRRARARRATAEEPVEVDARADDFIRRFREQLRLQRLDSILRCRDTLRRTDTA